MKRTTHSFLLAFTDLRYLIRYNGEIRDGKEDLFMHTPPPLKKAAIFGSLPQAEVPAFYQKKEFLKRKNVWSL